MSKRSHTIPEQQTTSLPAGLTLGPATLAVADRDRSLAFYRELLGMTVLEDADRQVTLGAGSVPILRLQEQPGIAPAPRHAPGLYHAAILLPDRIALGHVLRRLIDANVRLGAADHLVSEALYLDDPDGNGLEIYRDRPRSAWAWNGDQVSMASDPLDMLGILAEAEESDTDWSGMPNGTTLGHVHLRVGDAEQAEAFYAGVIGFDVVAQWAGARFMSAGGYHHHLGANAWESAGVATPPTGTAGLREWQIVLPTDADIVAVRSQLDAAGITSDAVANGFSVHDPWDTRLVIRTAGTA